MAGAEEPDDAVSADRPTAARARILHDVQSGWRGAGARRRDFEEQRRACARRVETPQAEVDGVGNVPSPDERPPLAGYEAAARNRSPVVECCVGDVIYRVLVQVLLRH